MADLESIIARLEKGETGSKIDAELHKARWPSAKFTERAPGVLLIGEGGGAMVVHQPYYTTSLDAALSLAPEIAWLNMGHRRGDDGERVCYAGFDLDKRPYTAGARAATFPLALCIAALRARAAS